MLTGLQERIWRILSALPEAAGFALAGGAALILTGVVQRGSDDLDIFGEYPVSVTELAEAAVEALNSAGLTTTVKRWGGRRAPGVGLRLLPHGDRCWTPVN